jgi:hypothetical protein
MPGNLMSLTTWDPVDALRQETLQLTRNSGLATHAPRTHALPHRCFIVPHVNGCELGYRPVVTVSWAGSGERSRPRQDFLLPRADRCAMR